LAAGTASADTVTTACTSTQDTTTTYCPSIQGGQDDQPAIDAGFLGAGSVAVGVLMIASIAGFYRRVSNSGLRG
jgi:hypothetical protein